ncbi:hypothetical protein AB0O07_18895 [Streptomyces sp. NPDC093085]|uniref:hypothetical protein n=1 Tax=Streptomyces sp. NPDC093085 TaxID=3155068 RepID=UPI003448623D
MFKDRENETLRRISFKILSWVSTIAFGLAAAGLTISLTYSFESGPTFGVAACLFTIALIDASWARISCSGAPS